MAVFALVYFTYFNMTTAYTCRVAIHDLNTATSTTLHFGQKQHCGLCIRQNIVMQQDQGGTELFISPVMKINFKFLFHFITDQTGTFAQ